MPSPTASQASSICLHLRAIKENLQDVIPEVKIAMALDQAEFDVLEQDAFEVLRLIRSWRNMVAPISKIPPEILVLVPGCLDPEDRDQGLVALTHVCRTWREVFVSWPSLWADFDCEDEEKTEVYLKRSKSSVINLSLCRTVDVSLDDPFFWVIPRVIGRLKSLSIKGTPDNVPVITAHLSHPAPLLEHLTIYGDYDYDDPDDYPTLTSALFNGDLSSLRTLHLDSVRTELPWRNMVNLTSFTLAHTPRRGVSVRQLLDFFEGAPHLCEVILCGPTPAAGAQNGRLVSLVCLKSMHVQGGSPSLLLDHLLIPVGAKLTTQMWLSSSLVGEHLPRSLDNLKNLSNFTTIQIYANEHYRRVKFSGPNGEVNSNTTITTIIGANWTELVLESLARLDTSKTERLEIDGGDPRFRDPVYQALLPMTNLHTLTLSKCEHPHVFIHALHPGMGSSKVMVCPKLEELVLVLCVDGEESDLTSVIEMAAARASRGEKLGTIRIVDGQDIADLNVLELRKHVRNVEYSPWAPGL